MHYNFSCKVNNREGTAMYQHKLEADIRCPLEYGLQLFGGKWKPRIVCVLAELGTLRYSTLREEMSNITDAVLASTLKELRRDGMIERVQYNEIPPHVEYKLTEKGKSVVPILRSICKWAGVFYNEDNEHTLKQCQKCNYR
jgi:DNA-binding HxlR family transcriptional regulator